MNKQKAKHLIREINLYAWNIQEYFVYASESLRKDNFNVCVIPKTQSTIYSPTMIDILCIAEAHKCVSYWISVSHYTTPFNGRVVVNFH